jgi:hypothetical protein
VKSLRIVTRAPGGEPWMNPAAGAVAIPVSHQDQVLTAPPATS